MNDFPTIEDGIPVRERHWQLRDTITNFLRTVKPRQSFVVPYKEAYRWRTCISQREFKGCFITRRIDHGNVRIWRKEEA